MLNKIKNWFIEQRDIHIDLGELGIFYIPTMYGYFCYFDPEKQETKDQK